MRKTVITPYDEKWAEMFHEEAKNIKTIFAEELLDIQHIGSTSIPGMYAKPIIDILVEVQDIEKVNSFNEGFMQIGFIPRGENGISGRRFFTKGGVNRTHHLHIYQTGAKELAKHLAFRDYLIEHPFELESYSKLKRVLARQYPENVKVYQEQKSDFVNELTKKAHIWAEKNKKTSVMGFILREKQEGIFELLSLAFKSIKNAPWRVPGGGVEQSENVLEALYREIREESGLSNLTFVRKIGVINYYKPYIKRNVERHDFLLLAPSSTPDSWEHEVTGKDKDAGMVFTYQWIKGTELVKIDGELRSFLTKKFIPELFS